MAKYKWEFPGEWLQEKIQGWDEAELRSALLCMLDRMDNDDIQDIFQTEMDQDGYFEEISDNMSTKTLRRNGGIYHGSTRDS